MELAPPQCLHIQVIQVRGLPDPSEEPEVIEASGGSSAEETRASTNCPVYSPLQVGSSTLQRSNPGSCVLFLQSVPCMVLAICEIYAYCHI